MVLTNIFLQNKKADKITKKLLASENIALAGLSNSPLVFFIAGFYKKTDRNVLLLAYDNLQVERYYEDLIRLVPEEKVLLFPEKEALPHEQILDDLNEIGDRLRVLQQNLIGHENKIIITSAISILRRLMPVKLFNKLSLQILADKEYELTELSERLTLLGYERVAMVEDPAQYSIRGGILDVYTLIAENPCRVEFFGDEIDSIRLFDPVTQRSTKDLDEIIIPPAREIIFLPGRMKEVLPEIRDDYRKMIDKLTNLGNKEEAEYLEEKMKESLEKLAGLDKFPGYEQFLPYLYLQPGTLLDYFPEDTLIFYDEIEKIFRRLKDYSREIAETQATLLEQGSILSNYIDNFISEEEIKEQLENFNGCYFSNKITSKIPSVNISKEYEFESRGVEP